MAAGAVVVSLCSTSDETIEEAEKDLPRNLCPLIKSSYGFGKTDKCPYFYFSDLVVGETTCDGKKKMYEYMAEFKAVHVMQLPNSASDAASRALWKTEILRLQQVIEARFGTPISEAALREAERAHAAMGCRGVSRSDFRYDDVNDDLVLLEVNTQPGMTPTSLAPEQAGHAGIDFPALVTWMVEDALCR